MRAGFVELLLGRGVDPVLGRTLRKRLVALGLADVGAEAYVAARRPVDARRSSGPTPCCVRDELVGLGLGADVERHLEALDAGHASRSPPHRS